MSEPHESVVTPPRDYFFLALVLLLAFTLDTLLYSIVIPFLPARVLALGASQSLVGVLFASYAAGLLLMTPLAGRLTDRFGGQLILELGLLLLLVSTLVFALASNLPLLFLARTLQGVAAAIPWTAGLTIITEHYSGTERYRRFTQVFSATSMGTLVGPSLGGLLYTWRGFQAPFVVVAALIVLDAVAMLAVFARMPHTRGSSRRNSAASTVTAPMTARSETPLRRLLDYPHVATALLITGAGALLLALLDPTLPVLLSERYGLVPVTIGLVFGGMTILFILLQSVMVALLKKYSTGTALFFGLTIGPLALILVAVSATLVHVLVALGILALSFAFLLTPALELLTQTAQQTVVQPKRGGAVSGLAAVRPKEAAAAEVLPYGTVYAGYNVAYAVGMLLGPTLAGVAVTLLGWTLGLALTGFALLLLYLPLSLKMFFGSPPPLPQSHTQEQTSRIEIMEIMEAVELVQIVATEEIFEIEEIEEIEEIGPELTRADKGVNGGRY